MKSSMPPGPWNRIPERRALFDFRQPLEQRTVAGMQGRSPARPFVGGGLSPGSAVAKAGKDAIRPEKRLRQGGAF